MNSNVFSLVKSDFTPNAVEDLQPAFEHRYRSMDHPVICPPPDPHATDVFPSHDVRPGARGSTSGPRARGGFYRRPYLPGREGPALSLQLQ